MIRLFYISDYKATDLVKNCLTEKFGLVDWVNISGEFEVSMGDVKILH